LTFIRSGFGSAILLAVLPCVGCGSSESGTNAPGSAGQPGNGGGQGGAHAGPSRADAGASGEGGSSSAGVSGEAGSEAGAKDRGEAGAAGAAGSPAEGGDSAGNAATAGAPGTGGGPARDECTWQPTSVHQCPACDSNADCARPGYKYVGSGAITSSCCGFEWQEGTAPGKYSWSEASAYCANLSLLDGGWRLPTIAELFSLVELSDEAQVTPTIDLEAFSDTFGEGYWSSSPEGGSGQTAWIVDFSDGTSQPIGVDQPLRVRCLR
jgi:uncharacterized protein DUF1566